ncbi:MAG: helix-turn-helix domain-containing protein [Lachnospiraceae bacterium]|nr:helix-turn-helix domain-containing protein [Lachnospiraceae bacterium]
MNYTSVHLDSLIEISEIVTIHYFEYASDFYFAGEAHDFWEFICVDQGEVDVTADGHPYTLTRGDILFHKPGEFHQVAANHWVAPNLVVVSFYCDSKAMDFFRERRLVINDYERQLIARIISEAEAVFSEPLNNPYQTHMKKRSTQPIGAEQCIQLHLELLLLSLLRRYSNTEAVTCPEETVRRKMDDAAYHHIMAYLEAHLSEHLTLDKIARDTHIGKSRLQQLIHKRHGCGVIDLFSQLKINTARRLIRENHMNFTEIAEYLGYSSVHYFSRQFKKLSRMSPSEYSSSIKGLSDHHQN